MRRLGKTSLLVNQIGFGGIPIQRVTEQDVCALFDEMQKQGIQFVDTARAYTSSEEMIGKALVGRRDQFVLATKSLKRTYEGMKEDIQTSLNNLQTTWIDLYQIHNIKANEDYSGAWKALEEAKQAGFIHHIGITSHSFSLMNKIIREGKTETIMFPYNFLEQDAETLFQQAHKKGIGTIVMKPLAGGVIEKATCSLKFILQNEDVDIVIPGMATIEEVKENAVCRKGPFTQAEEEYMYHLKRELEGDFCHRCGYCLPCSVGIDIPAAFLFEGYYRRYDLKEWAKERYQTLAVKVDACIECGLCEMRCPYSLKIIEKLKRVKGIFHE